MEIQLTHSQRILAAAYMPIIADMSRTQTVQDIRGHNMTIYKYDEKKSAPMLTEALCFQTMTEVPNFKSGIARDEEGKFMFDSKGKAIMERNLAKQARSIYKSECMIEYGENWRKVFYHGHL